MKYTFRGNHDSCSSCFHFHFFFRFLASIPCTLNYILGLFFLCSHKLHTCLCLMMQLVSPFPRGQTLLVPRFRRSVWHVLLIHTTFLFSVWMWNPSFRDRKLCVHYYEPSCFLYFSFPLTTYLNSLCI